MIKLVRFLTIISKKSQKEKGYIVMKFCFLEILFLLSISHIFDYFCNFESVHLIFVKMNTFLMCSAQKKIDKKWRKLAKNLRTGNVNRFVKSKSIFLFLQITNQFFFDIAFFNIKVSFIFPRSRQVLVIIIK